MTKKTVQLTGKYEQSDQAHSTQLIFHSDINDVILERVGRNIMAECVMWPQRNGNARASL